VFISASSGFVILSFSPIIFVAVSSLIGLARPKPTGRGITHARILVGMSAPHDLRKKYKLRVLN
jgi:hypothetical protein